MSHPIHAQMGAAMKTVRKILELTRTPRFADEEDHVYDDKFGLAEFVVNSAIAAQVNALEALGLEEEKLLELSKLVSESHRNVTLRFDARESCEFIKKEQVEVESPHEVHSQVTEQTTGGRNPKTKKTSSKHKVVTKVDEYHWKFHVSYDLYCFSGNDPKQDRIVLQSRESSTTITVTGTKEAPFPAASTYKPIELPLSWLLQNISADKVVCAFRIDRSCESCRTPLRNDQVKHTLDFLELFGNWVLQCKRHFATNVERRVQQKGAAHVRQPPGPLQAISSSSVFVPVLPLLETKKEASNNQAGARGDQQSHDSPLLSIGDVNRFLEEESRSLDEAVQSLDNCFPASNEDGKLVSVVEAKIVLVCSHLHDICSTTRQSLYYIEDMLRNQLVAAIGKEVHPKDFEEYMRFHNQRLLGAEYAPSAFCYTIRRPNHYPDGVLSIETQSAGSDKSEPIETIVRVIDGEEAPPMHFPLNAATSVVFTGKRYLHAWIKHRFASASQDSIVLTARARQFSSFMLLVGTISGPDKFDPKDAIILRNKDEVLIPLLLNELPTPKEFKDAISSLSPEQQRFAKSFRGMQLASSVFGVCVIQIKPQLEKLLGLPEDALTKEIGLTQDLLSLFIDYQIPSDLLSFDGSQEDSVGDKVETVKRYVKNVQEVVDSVKAAQLAEEVSRADMRAEMAYQDVEVCQPQPMIQSGVRRERKRSNVAGILAKSARPPVPAGAFTRAAAPECEERSYACRTSVFGLVSSDQNPEFLESGNAQMPDALSSRMSRTPTGKAGMGMQSKNDFTAIPNELNAAFDEHDRDNALRTTIIKPGEDWRSGRQENLLSNLVTSILTTTEQKTEKNKAFDLLDALSRSGSLPIACAELHVVLGVTHCFENTVMNTVIEGNVNPIEKMEHSTLLIASIIHNTPAARLLITTDDADSPSRRVEGQFPPATFSKE